MSKYTMSLMDILQENKASTQNLNNVDDVYDLALNHIFDLSPINVIDNEYREAFIKGFTLHFFMDEIGLETLPLWKIALNEKLVNNASYINQIYRHLDRQIFSEYTVEKHNATNEHAGTIVDNIENERKIEGNDSVSSEGTSRHSDNDSTISTENSTGNSNTIDTFNDSNDITKTGNNITQERGNTNTSHTGSIVDDLTSNTTDDKHTNNIRTGGENVTETRNTHTVENGGYTDTVNQNISDSGTDRNDTNAIQYNFDTPQNSLQNMRTPGGPAAGKGVDYSSENEYKYMSSAVEQDSTNVNTRDTTQVTDGSTVRTFNDHDTAETGTVKRDASATRINDNGTENATGTRNEQNTKTFGDSTRDDKNLDTTNKINEKEVNAHTGSNNSVTNDTSRNEANSSTQRIGEVVDTRTDTSNRSSTDAFAETKESADNSSDKVNSETERYTINWELLYKTMPLLDRVWSVFDDIFMILL